MGVFSTMLNENEFDFSNVEELNVEDYANASIADNLAEEAMLASVSIHNEHKALIESLAAQEISAMEEGYEVVYEATSLSSIGDKIKSLIKKAIEKIKALFAKVVAVFRSWTSSDKEFIRKYQTQFTKNWVKLKKLDIKAYTYIDDVKNSKMTQPDLDTILKGIDAGGGKKPYTQITAFVATDLSSGGLSNANADYDDIKDAAEKRDTSDFYESIRGEYFNTATSKDNTKRTAKEFSDDVFEYLRNGEDSKDSFDKKDLESKGYSSTDIIKALTNNEKTASDLDKEWKKSTKAIEKIEKNINKAISKLKFNDSTHGEEYTKAAYLMTLVSGMVSTVLETDTQFKGLFLQACKEYSRTCKTIATKVVAMGEKRLAQEESYDFGNDDYESSYGFMNSVVIK